MARYTGPRQKISRRLGVPVFGPSKALERKNYAPGIHGPKARRKLSEYGEAVAEKQKLKHTYGVLEKQFRRYFEIARSRRGVTGETLLELLETRLDNVVFRLGFATSRRMARQMVSHRHILHKGRRVSIPSITVKPGDVIEVRNDPGSRKLATFNLEAMQITPVPDWLALDKENFRGTVQRVPTREDIQPLANEQLVVELYSR
jgi:small subunit ribosomal protein S4